mgnify:CR=1 FL=1|tara:strand:- start:282 stop:476 length:195 start_codon:yes stop_codon:yes gene_type:complete
MVCACSAIATSTNNKNLIPLIQKYSKTEEIQRLKNYIKNHPNKDNDNFKNSMSIILQEILKSFN